MTGAEVSTTEGVARVVLDRPPLNVIDLDAARELCAALEAVGREHGLSAVVIEARGKAFCAGVDVRDHLPDRGTQMLREFDRACEMLIEMEVPVIAAVHGPALGGGCELAMVCDLVWAAESARFGVPEIRLGVFPPVAAVALARLVPPAIANEMVLTGRILTAAEAERFGLVNRVEPDGELASSLDELLAALRSLSPAALRAAKRALRLSRMRPTSEEIALAEHFYLDERLDAPDAIEGLTAFLEKRAPRWPKS
jgi:cyclohexa-1,5-dienecarbonyl-CoA hydratase